MCCLGMTGRESCPKGGLPQPAGQHGRPPGTAVPCWGCYAMLCCAVQVAKISPQIERQVLTEGVRPEVREAILSQLYL